MRFPTIGLVCLLVGSSVGAGENFSLLMRAETLRIKIDGGTSTTWDDGQRTTKPSDWDVELVIDAIDKKAGTARLIGNAGSEDLVVFMSMTGLHFIERTPLGGVTVLSVLAARPAGVEGFTVVYSRHISALGDPVLSQYYGHARITEPVVNHPSGIPATPME